MDARPRRGRRARRGRELSVRVGVTGAAGYVGRAVVRALAARGHEVVALARGDAAVPDAARTVRGDLLAPATLAPFAAGLDACVHAAAYVHRRDDAPGARAACFAVNEGGTRALLAALAAARAPWLVFVSSTAVYGECSRGAREDRPPAPVSAYGESKLAAERAVLAARAAGTPAACVLRPCVVVGPGAPGNAARLAALVRRGVVPLVRGGANARSVVHVDDLADAAARAVEAGPAADGRVWNVAGAPITVRAMVEAVARGLGVRARWVPVPGALYDAAAALASWASAASGGRLPDLGRRLEVFAGEATVDGGAIARDLGVVYRPSEAAVEQAARETAAVT
uniref:NAD-dependent epimerase/dehydratase family protein n=1 Tax=Eiseniibacteriota bacterium TaxID=2212470 RepID=A0A832I885_UNCEI